MVSEMRLYTEAEFEQKAQQFSAVLSSRGVQTKVEVVEKLNARFYRLNPELALSVDIDGLWLCANGMKMQPDWKAESARLKRASLKSEMIARACHLAEKPNLIDATAGLGHDSLLMAHLGANVTLLERHPILFTLLEDSHAQAMQDPFLSAVAKRIQLVFSDSADYLIQQAVQHNMSDVVYLDPMFPEDSYQDRKTGKGAKVGKHMQALHHLAQPPTIAQEQQLLTRAQALIGRQIGDTHVPQQQGRVIVKRPLYAPVFATQIADENWHNAAVRFDGYLL